LEYLTKYASEPEKLSSIAKNAFQNISMKVDKDNFDSVKVIKQLMMQSVGLRDMSIQEVFQEKLKM